MMRGCDEALKEFNERQARGGWSCVFCGGKENLDVRKLGETTPKLVLCDKCFSEWNEKFPEKTA